MKNQPITVKKFGEKAILIQWPNEVKEDILKDIIGFNSLLKKELGTDFEFVSAYNSLTIISNTTILDAKDFEKKILELYDKNNAALTKERFLWKIPVCYDLKFGIDLEELSSNLNMTISQLIEMHTANEYIVYGIGFLPGFMYLGGVPESLETRRKDVPRLKVAKGAVGLAGKQTGIYPQECPGGWNIIGNSPVQMFNPKKEDPCMVSVGDKIKFISISQAEYDLHKIEGEVGIYNLEKILLNA